MQISHWIPVDGAELAVDGGMAAGAYYPGLPGAPF